MKPTWWAAAWAIYKKELRSLFLLPVAWVFLAGFSSVAGVLFSLQLDQDGEASLRGYLGNLSATLVFVLPLLTMRLLSEEERSGTWELLRTAPLPLSALLLGKWLASCTVCVLLLLLTAPIPGLLLLYGDPDVGALATSYLGLFLCCCSFCAVGLFASSLSRDPTVAGVMGVLLLLPSWLASASRGLLPESLQPWVDRVGLVEHLRGFAIGAVDTADLVWFACLSTGFLLLAGLSMEARRWS